MKHAFTSTAAGRGLNFGLSAGLSLSLGLLTTGAAQAQDSEAELLALAKAEPPLTVYDSTGKIKDMAESFATKYGLEAVGQKVAATAQLEMVIREAQAGNVLGDVLLITDTPAALATLLPQGFVTSWLPEDLAADMPERYRNPLAITTNANLWAYNTEVYDACPVSNIWQLTEPEWHGKLAMTDPLVKSTYVDWFNQMATHDDAAVAAAYEAQYGKKLETSEASATAAWIAALAENGPLVTDGDDRVSEAVGAPGQAEPFLGLLSSAKFRDVADKGYKMAPCRDLTPWAGWTYTKLALIAAGSDSPNAAKLFVRYVLSADGIAPQMADGKVPTRSSITMPDDEPSGLMAYAEKLQSYDSATGLDDYDRRQDWQDFWRIHYRK